MLLEAGHARWDTADHYTPEKHRLTCWEGSNLAGVPSTSSPINHTQCETLLCGIGHLCRNQLLQQAQVPPSSRLAHSFGRRCRRPRAIL